MQERLSFQFKQSRVCHSIALGRIRDLASGRNNSSNDIGAGNNTHQFIVAHDGQSFDIVFPIRRPASSSGAVSVIVTRSGVITSQTMRSWNRVDSSVKLTRSIIKRSQCDRSVWTSLFPPRRRSCSLMMPTTRPPSVTTGKPLIFCSSISRAASTPDRLMTRAAAMNRLRACRISVGGTRSM